MHSIGGRGRFNSHRTRQCATRQRLIQIMRPHGKKLQQPQKLKEARQQIGTPSPIPQREAALLTRFWSSETDLRLLAYRTLGIIPTSLSH